MDLRNLEQLLAIRAHGSFARAARALGISQPSLSQAVARLEDEFRVRLFERTATGSELTPIGELVVERAGRVMSEARQLTRDVELVAGGEVGEVRLGIGSAMRAAFLPRFLTKAAAAYPGLRVNVQVLDRARLVALLRARELDLAICAIGDEVSEGLVVTEVVRTHGVMVARPGHPILSREAITAHDLAEFPLASAGGTAEVLGLPNDHVDQYFSNDYAALAPLAAAGACLLLAVEFAVRPLIDSGALVKVPVKLDYVLSYAAITTRAAVHSPMISRLVREAEAVGAELYPLA